MKTGFLFILLLAISCQCGCHNPLILAGSPNLYIGSKYPSYSNVSSEHQNDRVSMIYATDRQKDKKGYYTNKRSDCLTVGECVVKIGHNVEWEDLIANSKQRKRSEEYTLDISYIQDRVIFPSSFEINQFDFEYATHNLKFFIIQHLADYKYKEAVIFIHGVNNSFEDAVIKLSQIWHLMGRERLPILYSWPAGGEGILRGYSHDRESAQFTIFHCKQFLRVLLSHPEIEKVHFITHSHGAVVLTTSLRELFIEQYDLSNIGNIVLIAPDVDWEVAGQRIIAEYIDRIPERFTVYVSKQDRIIALSSWLSRSKTRLGQIEDGDINISTAINFIAADNVYDISGHGYFLHNPAVLSDIILLINEDMDPGVGRPLKQISDNFWKLEKRYPYE